MRYHGEPVAIVAADHPETARRAAALVDVDYDPLPALASVEAALAPDAPALHPGGNALRSLTILHGDPDAVGEVVVRGTYVVGRQDQAFLGPESGLAIPDGAGGVELHIATQWLHADRDQVAAGLASSPSRSGSCWPAWAARSARARTCRCSCTPACWRCGPVARCGWPTRAASRSSATSTAIRRA